MWRSWRVVLVGLVASSALLARPAEARPPRTVAPAALGSLIQRYRKHGDLRTLKAIIALRDRRAVPFLAEVLAGCSERNVDAPALAAAGLGTLGDPAAIDPLVTLLVRTRLPLHSRAERVQEEAIRALATFGREPRVVDALIAVLRRGADEQSIILNRVAAAQLGTLRDPKAVPALIVGLFTIDAIGEGVPVCRLSLAQIGAPAEEPLLELLLGKNLEVEKLRRERGFDQDAPGLIQSRAAFVLGDLRPRRALPALHAILAQPVRDARDNRRVRVAAALGEYGDRAAVPLLTRLLADGTARAQERRAAASSLNFIGDRAAVPALWRCASDASAPPDVRASCASAYGNLGTAADAPRMQALARTERREEYQQAVAQLAVAAECQVDAACYGRKIAVRTNEYDRRHTSLKAAFELGRLPRNQALPVILATLDEGGADEVEWALMHALRRLAGKECRPCRERLKAWLAVHRRAPTFAGLWKIHERKVTLSQLGE